MSARRIAVFDLDGTLSREDTYLAFLLHFLRAHPARVLRTAPLPFAVAGFKLGLRDNTWLKTRFLASILGGTPRAVLDASVQRFNAELLARGLRPGALAALEAHRERGEQLVLATASFEFYVRPLADALGFDEVVCTRATWHGERLAGTLASANCYGAAKLAMLRDALGRSDGAGVTAYSDHHSDLQLLTWAERGVAVNPTRKLCELAARHRLDIVDWARAH